MDKEILSVNPLLNTHTSIKFRSVQKKKDGSKIYLEIEMQILEDFLYQQETMEAYTILMDFQIGTRVGELVVELRQKYIQNPPEGMTAKLVKNMSVSDLLDMHYLLIEDDNLNDGEFEEGF